MSPSEYIHQLSAAFHITLAESIDSIKQHGLIPPILEIKRNGIYEKRAQSCLSIPTGRLKWLKQMQSRYPGKQMAILRIDPKLLASLHCDLDYSSDETNVLISRFESNDFSTIVSASGDFACMDRIPPDAISVDEVI